MESETLVHLRAALFSATSKKPIFSGDYGACGAPLADVSLHTGARFQLSRPVP